MNVRVLNYDSADVLTSDRKADEVITMVAIEFWLALRSGVAMHCFGVCK